MSELTFEQMLEESFKTIRNGEVVDGTVIDVKPDEIILNKGGRYHFKKRVHERVECRFDEGGFGGRLHDCKGFEGE